MDDQVHAYREESTEQSTEPLSEEIGEPLAYRGDFGEALTHARDIIVANCSTTNNFYTAAPIAPSGRFFSVCLGKNLNNKYLYTFQQLHWQTSTCSMRIGDLSLERCEGRKRACVRRVYPAKVYGGESSVTAAIYPEYGAEEVCGIYLPGMNDLWVTLVGMEA